MCIRDSDECTAELESIQAAVDDLAFAVEPVPLPPGFAERVMAQGAAERPAEAGGARPPPRRWRPRCWRPWPSGLGGTNTRTSASIGPQLPRRAVRLPPEP